MRRIRATDWMAAILAAAIPAEIEQSICAWARRYVRLVGSTLSEEFDPDITPWIREPIERAGDGVTTELTFVKPVQSGGSAAGEILACYWLATQVSGDLQWNWEDDVKAGERWLKRIEKILQACKPIMARISDDRHKWQKGLVVLPHCNLTVQGVFSESNLTSDSIRFQINEEVHAWEPGRLAMAYNRTTASWNAVIVNISNAGVKGDQLHQVFHAGTQQRWMVRCPACKDFHIMRGRWQDSRPDLGGLRYDSAGCKRPDDTYDYNRLFATIRYQMPCGFTVPEDIAQRRALSLSGRYSDPFNTGAHLSKRSYTLEAVAVDYIPWRKLIEEKHVALRAMKRGDPSLWITFLQQRESTFWDPEDRPLLGRITLNQALKKNRAGLPGRFARFFALDRQRGTMAEGELPYWWLVIRDALPNGDSLLVYEGKCVTDEDAIGVLKEHGCVMRCGVADSGHDTTHVYQFCLRHGINAIKGSGEAFFRHPPDGARRIFSPEKPLHTMINAPPVFPYTWNEAAKKWTPHRDEPLFWLYSKFGIRERLQWLRAGETVKFDIPGDVSAEYQAHQEAEELQHVRLPRTNELQPVYVQVKERNDLYVCECYIAMLMEMAGLIGAPQAQSFPA